MNASRSCHRHDPRLLKPCEWQTSDATFATPPATVRSSRPLPPAVTQTATAPDPPPAWPSPARPPARIALILAFASIYLLWGSTYLGIRVAVETMPPFLMAGARFLTAGVLLFTFLKLRGAAWPTLRQWRANAIIGAFLLVSGNGFVVWAELNVPSGITALLVGVTPLFIVLAEWAWPGGARPRAVTAGALLLGFAGTAWLVAPWQTTARGGVNPAGALAVVAACLSWSIGSIYSRHSKNGTDPFVASSLQLLCGGTGLMVVALVHGDFGRFDLAAISGRSWTAFAHLVVAGSIIGFSTFVWLMKHSTPARVATYAYVNPIVAVALGWLVLGEPISSRTLVASAIIVTAVVIITRQQNPSPRSK